MSFYARATGGGTARLVVHDLNTGTALNTYSFAVPADSNWHNFTQNLGSYQGHRVILEFRWGELDNPGVLLSDISVTPDASNATDFYPSGFINGDLAFNFLQWWAARNDEDGDPYSLTFNGGEGHSAAGSLEQYSGGIAANRVTYPFVANNQTYTLWLKG